MNFWPMNMNIFPIPTWIKRGGAFHLSLMYWIHHLIPDFDKWKDREMENEKSGKWKMEKFLFYFVIGYFSRLDENWRPFNWKFSISLFFSWKVIDACLWQKTISKQKQKQKQQQTERKYRKKGNRNENSLDKDYNRKNPSKILILKTMKLGFYFFCLSF